MHCESANFGSGTSITINNVHICFAIVGRKAATSHALVVFIDQWDGITEISSNTDYSVSKSDNTVTFTNNTSIVANYMVLYV